MSKQLEQSEQQEQDLLKESGLVDETSEDSFPASDPPSWTPTQGAGAPAGHRDDGAGSKVPSEPRPETK